MLQPADFVGRGVHEAVDHILVGQEIRSFHGVPGVQLEVVAFFGPHHRSGAAFGADGCARMTCTFDTMAMSAWPWVS